MQICRNCAVKCVDGKYNSLGKYDTDLEAMNDGISSSRVARFRWVFSRVLLPFYQKFIDFIHSLDQQGHSYGSGMIGKHSLDQQGI